MDPVVHFELPVNDLQRARDFYQKLFGWTIKEWKDPSGKMEYWSVITKKGMDGPGINGGMMTRKFPQQPLTIYMHVASIDKTLALAVANGGNVCMPKMEIGKGMGFIACFNDPEGNMIGVHEGGPDMKKVRAQAAAKKSAAKKAPKRAKKPAKKSASKKKK